jgi:DNA-binding beta-propeller fold protein YncE
MFIGAWSATAAEIRAPTSTTSAVRSYTIDLPGPPFGVVATRDQKWAVVSLAGRRAGKPIGVAVLQADKGRFSVMRVVPTPSPTTGIVLTHDQKLLIAAAGDSVILLDVARMIRGEADAVVTSLSYDASAGSVYVNVTPDDRTLFVSDEQKAKITVLDLTAIRASGFKPAAVLGRIPVGIAPIALTFSPDGRWLYTTSQRAPVDWGWPKTIRREGATGDTPPPLVPEGAVIVLDVEKARTDPEHSIVARVKAGGSPVRLAISPAGDRVYVTLRNDHALRVFDAAKLRAGADDANLATISVGNGPVPVLVIDDGRKILVGNSNRFGAASDAPSTITVIAADKISDGARSVLGTISAGAFPREFHLAADGRTVFLTNFRSHSLLVLDSERLPLESIRK